MRLPWKSENAMCNKNVKVFLNAATICIILEHYHFTAMDSFSYNASGRI